LENVDRPQYIVFDVHAGDPLGLALQDGRGGSRGDVIPSVGCISIEVECHLDVDPSIRYLNNVLVEFGETVTANIFTRASTTECVVTCTLDDEMGVFTQTETIHTSCSEALYIGQDFGAMSIVALLGTSVPPATSVIQLGILDNTAPTVAPTVIPKTSSPTTVLLTPQQGDNVSNGVGIDRANVAILVAVLLLFIVVVGATGLYSRRFAAVPPVMSLDDDLEWDTFA
jgi:hypothetical protein